MLICGGRYLDSKQVCRWLESKFQTCYPFATNIIHGGAAGADEGARMYCRRNGVPTRCFPADWKRFGKRAGILRNRAMLIEGHADVILGFPGGVGTLDMIGRGRRAKIPINQIDMEELNSV